MTHSLYTGDCLDVMKTLPDNSIDTVVTDPPYGLSSQDADDVIACLQAWLAGEPYTHGKKGFMGKEWDGWTPGPEIWREVYRVLKPGGTALVFAGTRTSDLMSIALRLAGFRKIDEIEWIYGSGFPKASNISKMIDKSLDAEREVIGVSENSRFNNNKMYANGNGLRGHENYIGDLVTAPATDAANLFDGWYSALKPAHEPILVFQKPYEKTLAHNAITHGVAGLWIDGARVAADKSYEEKGIRLPSNRAESVFGQTHGKDEDWHKFPGNPSGRWPANLILSYCEDEYIMKEDITQSDREAIYGWLQKNT